MNIGKSLFNATGVIAVASILTACGGGGGGAAAVVAAVTPVGGAAFKGPFVQGSAVEACPFDQAVTTGDCSTATTKVSTTTTDDKGTFNLPDVTWSGASLVTVSGNYKNLMNDDATKTGKIKAVLVLGAAGSPAVKANPNVATTIAAEMLLDEARAAIAAGGSLVVDATLAASAGSAAAEALGLPAGTDPNALDLTSPEMFAVSAGLDNLLSSGTFTLDSLANSLATDVSSGLQLGSTPVPLVAGGTDTGVVTSLTTALDAAAVVANYTTQPTLTPAAVNTTLDGFIFGYGSQAGGYVYNALTIGGAATGAICTLNASTASTVTCTGTAPVANPTFGFGVGSGAGLLMPAAVYDETVTFDIADKNVVVGTTRRSIKGSITIRIDNTTTPASVITVPAGAVVSFSGVMSDGTAVSGTATNVASNVVTINDANGEMLVNAKALVDAFIAKVGNAGNGLLSFTPQSTYTFKIGTSAPVGMFDNVAGTIPRMVPLATSGLREITGEVTFQ